MLDKLSTAIQLPSPSCERSNGTCYYLYIVMCNNIFQWGDMYFHQKCGTARVPHQLVCGMWATIYFAVHKDDTLLLTLTLYNQTS